MQQTPPSLNVPIDVVRTIIAISETGSFTKAGAFLGISQPAISSQIKRAQSLIGGELFTKTSNGSAPTKLGALVLIHARKIVEANDQMLRLGGALRGPQPIRLGISNLYVEEFLRRQPKALLCNILISTDDSGEITKSLIDGYLDIACFFDTPRMTSEMKAFVVEQRLETFVWARSREFVISPGSPIPILSWAGAVTDDMMISALTAHNMSYRVAFRSSDYHAKISAAECGVGLTIIPIRMIPPSLVPANEYYLPPITPVMTYLCARSNLESADSQRLLDTIANMFFAP